MVIPNQFDFQIFRAFCNKKGHLYISFTEKLDICETCGLKTLKVK